MQTINIWALVRLHPECFQPTFVALGTGTAIFNRAWTFTCAAFAVQSRWVTNAVFDIDKVAIASEVFRGFSWTWYYLDLCLRNTHRNVPAKSSVLRPILVGATL